VAHELNTPLATMTLLAEDIRENAADIESREDAATMRQLIDLCRDRVRALAASADMGVMARVDLDEVVQRWRLVRPTVELQRSGSLPPGLAADASTGHLLQALLNNAADASRQAGSARVDLDLRCEGGELVGTVRDYGNGFHESLPFQSEQIFRTSKPDGMGVGLALSHATVERLGGRMTMRAVPPKGVQVQFRLPAAAHDEAFR